MTRHKFIYEYEGNTFLGERYPQHEVVIQSKCDDLDAHEILSLFKSYMLSCGYAEKSFYDACETAADENNPYRKGGNRYEVGETQWREKVSPDYQTTLRHAKDHIPVKDTNRIKDLLS
jgi:hypothetical protein